MPKEEIRQIINRWVIPAALAFAFALITWKAVADYRLGTAEGDIDKIETAVSKVSEDISEFRKELKEELKEVRGDVRRLRMYLVEQLLRQNEEHD